MLMILCNNLRYIFMYYVWPTTKTFISFPLKKLSFSVHKVWLSYLFNTLVY